MNQLINAWGAVLELFYYGDTRKPSIFLMFIEIKVYSHFL